MDYNTALAWCTSNNGVLPVPASDEENEFLRGLGNTFLGFDTSELDQLTWTNWRRGEPSGDGPVVQLLTNVPWNSDDWEGKWNDDSRRQYPATCYTSKGNTISVNLNLLTPGSRGAHIFAFLGYKNFQSVNYDRSTSFNGEFVVKLLTSIFG